MTWKDIRKVKYANTLMPLNLKVAVNNIKKSDMHNNWRANRAWNRIEENKVIIAIGPLSHLPNLTTGPQLLQISGWGGVRTFASPTMYLYGVFGKSAKKILVEIIELQHFLDNTNARQTGEKKNSQNLILLLAVGENSTPSQLWAHANRMGRIHTYRANTGHLLDKVNNAKQTSTMDIIRKSMLQRTRNRNVTKKTPRKQMKLMTNGQVTENIWTINRWETDLWFLNKFLNKFQNYMKFHI